MKKLVVLTLVFLLACTSFVFAAGAAEEPERVEDPSDITIGMTVPGLMFPFFVTMEEEAQAHADELGIELLTHDSENRSSVQMEGVETYVARGVDGILISPMTTDTLVPAIEYAVQNGIPVASVDRKADTDEVLVHVGADNVEGGRAAGRYIVEKLGGEGKVIQLEGTPGASPAIDRKAGFEEIINESDIEIIASMTAEFSRSEGQTVMEDLITAHPEFDAVFGANDEMIIGAIVAMEDAGIDPADVVTVGFDATEDAFTYMDEGTLDATVDQFPGQQAVTALDYLVDFIMTGAEPDEKEIYIAPEIVTE